MSFGLLFKDELKGFYKSKVMIFLWIGLPLMTVVLYWLSPYTGEDVPLSLLSALLVSSIGGTLGSAMLAVSIIHEKDQHTYDLFLIRPIKRWHLMISKFFAVFLCIAIACVPTRYIADVTFTSSPTTAPRKPQAFPSLSDISR